jgi:hypothetical protein
VALVGCTQQKRPAPCEARDLYVSSYFMQARRAAEHLADDWFILSARYGLLAPRRVVRAYNVQMKDFDAAQRDEWGAGVRAELVRLGLWERNIIFLAAAQYAVAVEGAPHVTKPLDDIRAPNPYDLFGARRRWLAAHSAKQFRRKGG